MAATTYREMFIPRGNKRALSSIVVDSIGTGMFLSLTLLYLWQVNGVEPAVAGPVVTAAAVLSFAALSPIARLAQAAGGRGGLMIASAIGAAGYLSYLWATSAVLVAVSAVVIAFGDRLMGSCWPLLAAERFDRRRLQDVFAIANAAKTFSLGAGAVFAATVLTFSPINGLRAALLVNVASFVIGFLVLLWVPRVTPEHQPGTKRQHIAVSVPLRDRPFMAVVVSQTALSAGWMLPAMAFPLFATENVGLPTAVATACLGFRYLLITALQVPLVKFAARWSRRQILLLSAASALVGVAVVATLPLLEPIIAVVGLFVATAFLGGSEVISKPTAMASALRSAPNAGRGAYMAVFQMSWSVAYALGPAIVGLGLRWPPALWVGVCVAIAAGTLHGAVSTRTGRG